MDAMSTLSPRLLNMGAVTADINGKTFLERFHDIAEIHIFVGGGAVMDAKRLEG